MSQPAHMTLAGFYRPQPKKPGFAVAVFRDDRGFWVQETEADHIVGFLPCDVDAKELLSLEQVKAHAQFHGAVGAGGSDLLVRKVGDERIVGFSQPDGRLEVGTRQALAGTLDPTEAQLRKHPFVFSEVARFTGDRDMMARADELTAALIDRSRRNVGRLQRLKRTISNGLRRTIATASDRIAGLQIGPDLVEAEGIEIGDRVRVYATIPASKVPASSALSGSGKVGKYRRALETLAGKQVVVEGVIGSGRVKVVRAGERAKKYAKVRYRGVLARRIAARHGEVVHVVKHSDTAIIKPPLGKHATVAYPGAHGSGKVETIVVVDRPWRRVPGAKRVSILRSTPRKAGVSQYSVL